MRSNSTQTHGSADADVADAPSQRQSNPLPSIGDYVLVSPVRNEADYMRRTFDSVLMQTLLPRRWIVVDDGSTDGTSQILREYASRYPLIEVHTRSDRGRRALGGGVVEVFDEGMRLLGNDNCEFVCKLDMDLDLPPRYFERLVAEMNQDPRLGSVSGKPYYQLGGDDGELASERIGDDVSAGMTKFYRRAFLDDIGGLVRGLLWDGIDCYRGRMRGWQSRSIDHPDLRFVHLRPMGASDRGILTGRKRLGEGYWFMGAALYFVAASALFRINHKPALIGSCAMIWGYLRAWVMGVPRYEDLEFRRFLRRYHLTMLLRGRTYAANHAVVLPR